MTINTKERKMNSYAIIFWHATGLRITVGYDFTLTVEDLNPQAEIKSRLTRKECFQIGWRLMLAAIKGVRK